MADSESESVPEAPRTGSAREHADAAGALPPAASGRGRQVAGVLALLACLAGGWVLTREPEYPPFTEMKAPIMYKAMQVWERHRRRWDRDFPDVADYLKRHHGLSRTLHVSTGVLDYPPLYENPRILMHPDLLGHTGSLSRVHIEACLQQLPAALHLPTSPLWKPSPQP